MEKADKKKLKVAEQCKHKPTRDEMWEIACLCVQLYDRIFPQVYKFANSYKRAPAQAIIKTLKAIAKYEPDDCWAYGVKVLDIESGKFFAGKNTEEHERLKKEDKEGVKSFKNILKGIVEGL